MKRIGLSYLHTGSHHQKQQNGRLDKMVDLHLWEVVPIWASSSGCHTTHLPATKTKWYIESIGHSTLEEEANIVVKFIYVW